LEAKDDTPVSELERFHEFCRRGAKDEAAELLTKYKV
jgi:hypothetical protein